MPIAEVGHRACTWPKCVCGRLRMERDSLGFPIDVLLLVFPALVVDLLAGSCQGLQVQPSRLR